MHMISYLTQIHFGAGAVEQLPTAIAELAISRPLIVSDHGLKASGLLDKVSALCPNGSVVFLDVPSNPTEDATNAALAMYKQHGCDGIVAIGGGSPIDLAKGVALLSTHEGPLERYAAIAGGVARINPVAPLIAVPTTAGTGSEVGRAALITLSDGRKLGIISNYLIPRRAICDPLLTQGLPPRLTAATGLDALSHCIETFLSPRFNPPAEAIALDGFERIWNYLPKAVVDGNDIEARSEVMMGALQGGLTFQKGLGAVHALSHALGALKELNLHHGTLNAILMPPVLRINSSAAPHKIARLEKAIGLSAGNDLATELEALNSKLEIPHKLSDLGLTSDMLPAICDAALIDHSHATNPRPLTKDDYLGLLEAVM